MSTKRFREQLKEKGLRITPQRVAIFEAVFELKNHPAADSIIEYIKKNHPNISVGTVYKVLDSLVENGLLTKVKSERDIMRYDAVMNHHHHLYCRENERIEDFEDPDLDRMLSDYFEKNKIKGFRIEDIKLQITGKFRTKEQ